MKETTITRELHHKVMGLAHRLQTGIESGNTWGAIESVESELAAIIETEAARLAGVAHRNAYFESLPNLEADHGTPSRFASITITRPQHSRVAAAAAERDQPMSRIVGDLVDQNL